jgi:hypothetical protein
MDGNNRAALFVSSSIPRKLSNLFALAGLLTYSFFTLPSRSLPEQWILGMCKEFRRSLQQRVCSGFAPDSLFSDFPERGNSPPKRGQR